MLLQFVINSRLQFKITRNLKKEKFLQVVDVKIKQNALNANLARQTMYIILWLHLSEVLSMRNKFRNLVHEGTGGAFIIADTFQFSHLCCLRHNLQISVQVALSAGTDILCSREQQYACLYHLLGQCATFFPPAILLYTIGANILN